MGGPSKPKEDKEEEVWYQLNIFISIKKFFHKINNQKFQGSGDPIEDAVNEAALDVDPLEVLVADAKEEAEKEDDPVGKLVEEAKNDVDPVDVLVADAIEEAKAEDDPIGQLVKGAKEEAEKEDDPLNRYSFAQVI